MNNQEIHLSKTERLLLANQMRILAKLDKTQAKGYENTAEALEDGHTFFYREIFQHIYDELSYERCLYVIEVMEMYWAIQTSYGQLTNKEGIKDGDLLFPGFDGNNETELMGFARYLRKRDRFNSLRVDSTDFNSHMPTNDLYANMMAEWNNSADKHRLTAADIKRIVPQLRTK